MTDDIDDIDLESDGEQTALDLTDDRVGLDVNWSDGVKWGGDDYTKIPIPDEAVRPKWEWETAERRAYLLGLLREYGHPNAVPQKQKAIGEEFGVSQQTISNDFDVLRKYIRYNAGDKAISTTELVAQKAVAGAIENEEYYDALRAQLEYNEWLFDLGRLERQPRKQQIEKTSVSVETSELSDEEEEHLAMLDEKLREGQSIEVFDRDAGTLDVEATEVPDDE